MTRNVACGTRVLVLVPDNTLAPESANACVPRSQSSPALVKSTSLVLGDSPRPTHSLVLLINHQFAIPYPLRYPYRTIHARISSPDNNDLDRSLVLYRCIMKEPGSCFALPVRMRPIAVDLRLFGRLHGFGVIRSTVAVG